MWVGEGGRLVSTGGTDETLEEATVPVRSGRRMPAMLRALRPHQWSKNVLLFVPLVLAHELGDAERWIAATIGFAGFCACASGSYLLNDVLDLDHDRRHPEKCHRPLAGGEISVTTSLWLAAALVLGSIGGTALTVGARGAWLLVAYTLTTALYSFILKRVVVLDILVLAGLFTLRVLAGARAAEVVVSPWLLVFSMFFFLGLAAAKRYAELVRVRGSAEERVSRRGYRTEDASLVQVIGVVSGYVAVLVIGLFISSDDVMALYSHYEALWLVCPLMLYWLTRIWFLAQRGLLSEDPVTFATKDPTSWAVGALVVATGVWASTGLTGLPA